MTPTYIPKEMASKETPAELEASDEFLKPEYILWVERE